MDYNQFVLSLKNNKHEIKKLKKSFEKKYKEE